MTRGRFKLWWTLEEDEGFEETEREIGDPVPTFQEINDHEPEGTGILDPDGNEIFREPNIMGFLSFEET